MELAVSPSVPGADAAALVDLCVEAERLGYHEAWLAEVAGPETFALAGAIARATSQMPIGVAVVPATTRTAALLAMAAATVSQLAAGRPFRLGIGSSSQVIVEGWHGGSFDRPLRLVREAVEATRAALAGEGDYSGEAVRMSRFRLAAPPAGPVDLYVGALGPRMLRLAGAIGDGVCLNLMPPEAVPRQLAEVRRGAADAGRELPAGFGVMARLHCVVSDDVAAARAAVRRGFGPYFAQPVYNRFLAWCGFPEEAEAIAGAWAAKDRAGVASAMHDGVVDSVAVVGPAGAAAERIAEYGEAGIGIAALNMLAPDGAAASAWLRALAPR